MPFTILPSKFFIPQPRKVIVDRQRLVNILEDGLQNKLILVSAPAGYGKTTLVASWLRETSDHKVWISLDEGDNNLNRFFRYFFEAFHQVDISVGDSLLQMFQTMPPAPESLIGLALHELSSLSQDVYLVMDDFHLVENPVIHDVLHQVIMDSPRELHFIILSRAELPFSVSKLRSMGEMLEITQSELALTMEEAKTFMNEIMGAGLSAEDISILQAETEGWLVGLQMVALSLHDASTNPSSFIRSLQGDSRLIGDYLVDEVLLRNPEEVREFLLHSSILNQMEATLCNYVLQMEDSLEMLELIDRRRLFIFPLDDYRHWFRYHHLFREMLLDRLVHRAPDKVKELNQRAAEWHATHGSKDEAMDYALLGGDYSLAISILKDIGLARVVAGKWAQVLTWFDQIPQDVILAHPDLWVVYFIGLINQGSITQLRNKIQEMSLRDLDALSLSRQELNKVKGEITVCRGVVSLHSQLAPSEAKNILTEACKLLDGDQTFRWPFATFNYGVSCFELGEIEEAKKYFEETIVCSRELDFSLARLIGSAYLADAHFAAGNLQYAHELFQESIKFAHRAGLQEGAVFSKTNLGLGSILYEWNQLDDALRYTQEGIRLAELGGYLNQLLFGYSTLMRIQHHQGNSMGMKKTIQQARNLCQKYGNPHLGVTFVEAMEAEAALLSGNTLIMKSWLDSKIDMIPLALNLFCQYEQVTLARVLAAQGRWEIIRDVIKPFWEASLKQGRIKDAIACEVILAKSLFMKGEPLPAIKLLDRALAKAEKGQFVRTFLDEGGVLVSMIKQILASRGTQKPIPDECSSEYLYFLLKEVAKDTLQASTKHPLSKTVKGMEPLTEQELRILKFIETGFSNKQIAREMSISLNTVKYHLKNIYGKLGVVNRTQAARMIRKEE